MMTVVSLPMLMSSTLFTILCVVDVACVFVSCGWRLPRDDADEEHRLWKDRRNVKKRSGNDKRGHFSHLANIFRTLDPNHSYS